MSKDKLSYDGGGRISVPVESIVNSPKVQLQVEAAREIQAQSQLVPAAAPPDVGEMVKKLRECHSYGCAATEPPYKSECSCTVGAICREAAALLSQSQPKPELGGEVAKIVKMLTDGAIDFLIPLNAWLLRKAAAALSSQSVGAGEVAVPIALVKFLLGEAPLENVWFGDPHVKRNALFWWRTQLRAAMPAKDRT